jgi:hypothetical protein
MAKGRLRAGFLFVFPAALLPAAAIARLQTLHPQQTVDGLHRALEIFSRSSYVPNAAIGV